MNASRKSPQASDRDYGVGLEDSGIERVQKEILNEAKKFTHDKDEFEILTELQHNGG